MGINCQDVCRDVSDYIDDELSPAQRAALDRHFAECRDCAALLDGMRSLIAIYRDERVLPPPPAGFHERLYQKLEKEPKRSRRAFLSWTLAAAAAVPFALATYSARNSLPRGHEGQIPSSSPDAGEGPDTVAISEDPNDKTYHVPGCTHLTGKAKFLSVKEAIREGYTPCDYCIAKAKPKKTG